MGEIDTKPIEPVQVALTLFGHKSDQIKHRPGSSDGDEMEIEELHKELANYKVQVEAKDAAHSQLLHKLDHYQKTQDELLIQLKNSEIEKDVYFEEYTEASHRIDELEVKVKEMSNQLSDFGKAKEQISHVLLQLKSSQGELLCVETELAAAQDAKLKALTEMEETRKELEMMNELENQLMEKKLLIDSLQVEVNRANEVLSSSDKVVSDVIRDMNNLNSQLDDKEKENSDQAIQIKEMESEMNQLKLELRNANDEVSQLNFEVETVTDELEKLKTEMNQLKLELKNASDEVIHLNFEAEKVSYELEEEKTEMDELKLELKHTNDEVSRLNFEAEMGTDEMENMKTEMNELNVELKNANNEVRRLNFEVETLTNEKEKVKTEMEETKGSEIEAQVEIAMLKAELAAAEERVRNVKYVDEDEEEGGKRSIRIGMEEYEEMKADKEEKMEEMEKMKKEMEAATAKVAEFRTRAEQARARAEAAERAKMTVEDQLRKWREQKLRRKAALAALREESLSREFGASSHETAPRNYQPLGQVLNMKF
ncbi:hypothetical protein M5689_017124 [Euphorbia peplus]|nr:hypothetical protein M5689_017124 [Euphorbia peplus]